MCIREAAATAPVFSKKSWTLMTNVHPSTTPTVCKKPSFCSWRAPEVCACLSSPTAHISIVSEPHARGVSLDTPPRVLPEVFVTHAILTCIHAYAQRNIKNTRQKILHVTRDTVAHEPTRRQSITAPVQAVQLCTLTTLRTSTASPFQYMLFSYVRFTFFSRKRS